MKRGVKKARADPSRSGSEEHVARVNRAIDYVERHLDEELPLERVAAEACFSPFHFHRIFRALTGETLAQFVRRVRIERAASQLVSNPHKSITEIALDSGFSGSAAFARAFRERQRMSPSQWRASGGPAQRRRARRAGGLPKAGAERAAVSFVAADGTHETWRVRDPGGKVVDVRVDDMAPTHVAYVRHTGPYKGDAALFGHLFTRLCRWAVPRGLLRSPDARFLAVYHDDPKVTAPAKLRVSACLAVAESVRGKGEVGTMMLLGGRYAWARFELAADEYPWAWGIVCGLWLPESGYQPDDRPFFERFAAAGGQDCRARHAVEICVPVRPL
jgi:AraC family transcriptional regulator